MLLPNYFDLFGLPSSFEIDPDVLEKVYFSLQRQFHPDGFVTRPATERHQAVQQSMIVNTAYQILRDPAKRACYMLERQEIVVGTEKDTVKPSEAVLMESMEWRETVEQTDAEHCAGWLNTFEKTYAQSVAKLTTFFDNQEWEKAAQETFRLIYLDKAINELRGKMA